ncbi:DUF6083 domain-containing protein [Streptomyces sp. x-80]|uniref:DUF6083 domain-containing protein n=1 Tax=Streptomyces sp. x-80 TaxID=2789282 RepID=UPI003981327D
MRVWRSSASKTLRRNAQDRCVYCGHIMECFNRFDGGRIPMVPMALPSARIPPTASLASRQWRRLHRRCQQGNLPVATPDRLPHGDAHRR